MARIAGMTRFNKVSGKTGLYVGSQDSEVQVASSTGALYIEGVLLTATAAQLNSAAGESVYLDGVVPGTQAAELCIVTDANVNSGISKVTELHIGASGSETQVTSTAAELNILDGVTATTAEINQLDLSANTESILAAGAVDPAITYSTLDLVGAGAVTLAAPDATMVGKVKVIEMTTDNGDVTLALTEVVGGSAATTCTWSAVGQSLVLVGAATKWCVVSEGGVALT